MCNLVSPTCSSSQPWFFFAQRDNWQLTLSACICIVGRNQSNWKETMSFYFHKYDVCQWADHVDLWARSTKIGPMDIGIREVNRIRILKKQVKSETMEINVPTGEVCHLHFCSTSLDFAHRPTLADTELSTKNSIVKAWHFVFCLKSYFELWIKNVDRVYIWKNRWVWMKVSDQEIPKVTQSWAYFEPRMLTAPKQNFCLIKAWMILC